jgi:hypothetical protein
MRRILLSAGLGVLLVLVASAPALSQSCALCYTQAASAGTKMIQALRSGILILIIPPTLASIGMVFVLRRKDAQFNQPNGPDEMPEGSSGD